MSCKTNKSIFNRPNIDIYPCLIIYPSVHKLLQTKIIYLLIVTTVPRWEVTMPWSPPQTLKTRKYKAKSSSFRNTSMP